MSLLELYFLKNNPFGIVPSRSSPFWADREKFKNDLERAIEFSLLSNPSQIIACIYGDWGCGKTHAMEYFSSDDILRRLADEAGIPKYRSLISIPTIFPTVDVFKSLYLDIVYRNLIPALDNVLNFLYKQITPLEREGSFEDKIRDLGINEDLSKVLSQFTNRGKTMLVRRYLSMNTSRNDLNKLGIAKGIETSSEMLNVLADMLKLLTRSNYSRIFIWIDDCERIEEVTGRSMFEFQYFLRDILDLVPERLTFIINFTLYPGEEIAERLRYLGPAVQNRISKIITVAYFDRDSYFRYVEDLIEYQREIPRGKSVPQYFPFNEKCLDTVFEMLRKSTSNLQPRTVNRVLSALLERGLRDKVSPIDEKFLERAKEEVEAIMAT